MLNNLLLGQAADEKLYVEDVFSTWLYTGNGSTQTITNGIDLVGKGGLVWLGGRGNTGSFFSSSVFDTARGTTKMLRTNTTNAQATYSTSLTSFNSNGFSYGSDSDVFYNNVLNEREVSWTFRKDPKFFDVVTYTGNGGSSNTINHNLGSVPGLIIVKRTDASGYGWMVYHRSLGSTKRLNLHDTSAEILGNGSWNDTNPTSTTFTVGNSSFGNASGGSYVAYLFAHDTTADGIVQCGSYTGAYPSTVTVNLGWEPQYILVKNASRASNWGIFDVMRGMPWDNCNTLAADSSAAENGVLGQAPAFKPTPTGFIVDSGLTAANVSGDIHIYLAIRRGPMRTPTDATKVYNVTTRNGTGGTASITGLTATPDALLCASRDGWSSPVFFDRLRGVGKSLATVSTSSEGSATDSVLSLNNTSIGFGSDTTQGLVNYSSKPYVNWVLSRAPGFFDVVCYTGTGSARTVSHNLGVAPELMIVKRRDTTADWQVYFGQSGEYMVFNTTAGKTSSNTDRWNNTAPTSAVFSLGTNAVVNASGGTYVAYLFSSCPGISKIGGYTGNGSSQNIDCGFTNGARFVLVKRTTATGSWTVFDTARGIVSAADPLLLLNTTDAEATNDSIDPLSSGFTINQTSSTNLNVNAATYIYLAIA